MFAQTRRREQKTKITDCILIMSLKTQSTSAYYFEKMQPLPSLGLAKAFYFFQKTSIWESCGIFFAGEDTMELFSGGQYYKRQHIFLPTGGIFRYPSVFSSSQNRITDACKPVQGQFCDHLKE